MLKTAQQREELCTTCPVAKVADLVGDSCVLLVIRDLLISPKRFGELQASLSGVSTRTLTQKLKYLEENNLVKRESFKERPPRVMYSLTKKGLGLSTVIESMRKYGKKL